MKMVVLNWPVLLAVQENLSHIFSSLKSEYVLSLTLSDDDKKFTGGGTCALPWIYGGINTY